MSPTLGVILKCLVARGWPFQYPSVTVIICIATKFVAQPTLRMLRIVGRCPNARIQLQNTTLFLVELSRTLHEKTYGHSYCKATRLAELKV